MAYGGHPDHGLSGVAGQNSAGTGMESAFGGQAIGVPGGAPAGQNEMGAFLDVMTQRYGPQSVKNFVDNYLTKQQKRMDEMMEQMRGPFPPGGRRAFGGMPSPGTAVATAVNSPPVSPELENSPQSQMTRVPFGDLGLSYPAAGNMFDSLDAVQRNTNNFTNFSEAYSNPSVLADAMPALSYGPAYGGGGDYRRPYMSDR